MTVESLAMLLKTLLHNGKETPWADEEQRRYYIHVVSLLIEKGELVPRGINPC
jgi:hypothetical protein